MRFLRKFISVIALLLISAAALVLALEHFLPSDSTIRAADDQDPTCREAGDLRTSIDKPDWEAQDGWDCMLRAYRYGAAAEQAYDLAFLEFKDSGELRDPRQLEALESRLSGQEKNFVVFYVHGWRNSAGRNNTDVQSFHTILAYMNQFLRSRQRQGRYRGHKLTGVYVGWRGSSLLDCPESTPRRSPLCSLRAAPSIFLRKPASDRLGEKVVSRIKGVENLLRSLDGSSAGEFQKNKVLVLGHSLGGNILMQGLKDQVVASIGDHDSGAYFQPPLGDLTVAINPASEAGNWLDIQRALLNQRSVAVHEQAVASAGVEALEGSSGFFPSDQRPVLVSMTSACEWSEFRRYFSDLRDRKIDCDQATYSIFHYYRIAHKIFTLEWSSLASNWREETTALGHIEADFSCPNGDATPGEAACRGLRADKRWLGTTHELDVNPTARTNEFAYQHSPQGRLTRYSNAANDRVSACEIADGWLRRARGRARGSGGALWDTGYVGASGANALSPLVFVSRDMELTAQFRHGLYRGVAYPITTARDPFWNVRALDSAIFSHGHFKNYPTLCAISQLVLDDVTK